MKKAFVLLLTLALMIVGFAAHAEAADVETIRCEIENGSYIIHIPDENGDLGWLADDMSQDDSIVKLARAELENGEFVVQYDPVGDGAITVIVRHFTGIACDEALTWDLLVEGGAVVECTGGSHTASPDPAEFDPYILGEWQTEDGLAAMTVEKNPGGGAWDVEIAGALAQGGYVFKTTIYHDCEANSFVYDKGKYWDAPITDAEDDVELGEARVAGTTGIFILLGDESALRLEWFDSDRLDETLVFVRADAAEPAAQDEIIARFSDTWAADGFSAEIAYDEDAAAFTCQMALNDESFCDYADCTYDTATDALMCKGGQRYFATYNEETADYDYDIVDTDLTAVFTVAGDTLSCEDSLGMLKGLVFMRLADAEDAMAAAEASEAFTQADMDAAVIAIRAEFSGWKGCEMHSIRYAGDAANSAENVKWLNDVTGKEYVECMEFLSDFHSPVEGGGAWEADQEYKDWQWWLAREAGGDWELVTWGY